MIFQLWISTIELWKKKKNRYMIVNNSIVDIHNQINGIDSHIQLWKFIIQLNRYPQRHLVLLFWRHNARGKCKQDSVGVRRILVVHLQDSVGAFGAKWLTKWLHHAKAPPHRGMLPWEWGKQRCASGNHIHSGKAYEGTCRIPRQNGDGRGIASARFVWIMKAIESAAKPHVVCGY